MLDNVTLIGRHGKDPEVRFTKSGIAVCNFSLATDIKLKGEKVVSWHNITIWGNGVRRRESGAEGLFRYV